MPAVVAADRRRPVMRGGGLAAPAVLAVRRLHGDRQVRALRDDDGALALGLSGDVRAVSAECARPNLVSTPSTRCSVRSVRAARSGSCVTMTRLVPTARFSSSIRSNTCPAVRRSRLPVGSSASTQRGSVTSARASATRCRSPPDSSPGRCRARCSRPDPLQHLLRRGARRRRRHPSDRERHRDVFERGEFRQQMMELVDEAERAVAHRAALAFPKGG